MYSTYKSYNPSFSYANINSLSDHLTNIQQFLSSACPLLFFMCETWLTPLQNSQSFNINDYFLVRNDRGLIHKHSGKYIRSAGVGLYVHVSCICNVIIVSDNTNINQVEYLIAAVQLPYPEISYILVAVVCRQPNRQNQLDRISSSYKHLLISGDLNYNLLEETYGSTHLKTVKNNRVLIILPTGASRHTPNMKKFWARRDLKIGTVNIQTRKVI